MFSHGQYDEARAYAKTAAQHAPEDFGLAADLVHLAGKLADKKGNYKLAEELMGVAFKDEPGVDGHGSEFVRFYARRGG